MQSGFLAAVGVLALTLGAEARAPGLVLDLSGWKVTLPVDTERSGRPDEVVGLELVGFVAAGLFQTTADGGGVVFRAPCGGVATAGSGYPRCELREMEPGGNHEAAWSTGDEMMHTLTMALAITHLPKVKPHVVCAQIHDANDDLLMVRLEGKKLLIERSGQEDVLLDANYALGTAFQLRVQAGRGRVRVWHNAALKLDWEVVRSGCYFKAGCYTQSNPQKGDAAEDFGEVVVRELTLARGF